ncbi:hypothetical protein V5O48_012545 [Marasmius crinis-equi]|uniref:Uncharacterized protein n=1 Tax=Marasmius crinis-equi TaxID=585013 RepID=A0ABR3F2H8_9AGAR
MALPNKMPDMESNPGDVPTSEESKPKAGTKSSADYLHAFMEILHLLMAWLLLHKWDPNSNLDCLCGNGQ